VKLKILASVTATVAVLAPFLLAVPVKAQNPDHVRQLLETKECEGCDLRNADLFKASLYRANLRGADLSGANLYEANLLEADLSGANLANANLVNAEMYGADLDSANLRNADLSNAFLGLNFLMLI
jgi:uncharacterized protein YjbI with pentapeptide repeats